MLEAMGSRLSIERDYAGSTLFGKLLEMRLFLDREPPEWLLQRFNWRHYLGDPFHERNALLLARELYAQRRVEGLRGAAVLLSSHFPFVRQRAVEFLRETAGGGFGFRARASLPERTAAVNQWWQWVTEKGAEHLPQMPTRQPPPVPHELF
jgi:hypothetical protein